MRSWLGNSISSDRRLRLLIGVHLFWLFLVCLMGAWWGKLLLMQSQRIAELSPQDHQLERIQRMLYWESPTFFGLLLLCSALLLGFYWVDVKRSRGLQAFFASVTHELRTPLTSIRLQAESIAESLTPEFSERELVQRLLEDTLRLEAQVERTLELARLEGGGPVYLSAFQIKPWLDRFIQSWSLNYPKRVEFDLEIEDVWIQADPSALQVIFKNIFENSIRHSGLPQVRVSISARRHHGNHVQVLIRDSGSGCGDEKTELGSLFQKGSKSTGTGVGLYLVRVLMKRMGGTSVFQGLNGFEVALSFQEANSHD